MGETKSFERRRELIAAAIAEFAEKSFEAASLNHIIETAAISKGTFYYHFPSKEELFFYLVDYAVQRRLEFVADRMVKRPDAADLDLFENLKLQAVIGVDFALEHPDLVLFAKRAVRERGPIAAALMQRLAGRTSAILRPLLERAVAAGELRGDLDLAFTETVLSHLLLNFDELFVAPRQTPDRTQVYADLDRYFAFIKHGLAGPACGSE
jgi:AcrR family transcriptional regulator